MIAFAAPSYRFRSVLAGTTPRSSSGLGRWPLTPETGVRNPYGAPIKSICYQKYRLECPTVAQYTEGCPIYRIGVQRFLEAKKLAVGNTRQRSLPPKASLQALLKQIARRLLEDDRRSAVRCSRSSRGEWLTYLANRRDDEARLGTNALRSRC